MKTLDKYMTGGVWGNLGITDESLAKEDIERLKKFCPTGCEYEVNGRDISVVYPRDNYHSGVLVFTVPGSLPGADVNSIRFAGSSGHPVSYYIFQLLKTVKYPGNVFSKIVFPKRTELEIRCNASVKLDDNVFRDAKFEDDIPGYIVITDEVSKNVTIDLSGLSIPVDTLKIYDGSKIIFNPKQKINKLVLRVTMLGSIPTIDTLPDIKELNISPMSENIDGLIEEMFKNYKPRKRVPKILIDVFHTDDEQERWEKIINGK